MIHKKFFPTRLAYSAIILLSMTMISCNNDDTSTSTSSTSSMSTTSDTPVAITNAPQMAKDSGMATTNAMADSKMNMGMAKPNPAKKGMKGKVIVTAPEKGTGTMEMDNTGVYNNVEYIPSFPGGNAGLQKYFDDNLNYPEAASNDGVEGTVKVSFIVDENGKLSSPQIIGEKMGYGMEDEALRVVQKMPSWNPGKLKGKNVKTRYTLPIKYQLSN